jgi:hypothetical protein
MDDSRSSNEAEKRRRRERPSYQLIEVGVWQLFERMRREGKSLSEVLAEAESR